MNDGHDHLVARPDAHRAQRDRDRVGAVRHADRVRGAAVGGELPLERAHLRAEDVALGVEHPLDRRAQLVAQRRAAASRCRTAARPSALSAAPSSSRSARVIRRISSSKRRPRLPAEVALGLRRVADQVVDLGGAHERRVDRHVALEVAEARPRRRRSRSTRAPSAPRPSRSRSPRRRRAGASATSPRRSPWRSPSRVRRRGCRGAAPCASPCLIAAACQVILRVTNSRPRRGDSWLKRIPEVACRS